jgi:integration host factor subunit alpha
VIENTVNNAGMNFIQNNPFFSQEHPPMTLTKDHLIGSIRDRLGISKFESLRILESLLETVKTSLSNGEDVLISGFGKFIVKEKAARKGRNPATGEDLTLDPRRVITFKCSPVMRDRVSGKGE